MLRDRLQEALGRDYRVERELGGGGMSRVFQAVEVELDRPVVIKVLPPEMAADVSVERFRREIQVAAGLQHPHIVPLHAAGRAGDLIYYTMPLVEGESLRARLDREGPMPVTTAVGILRDVADALAYAHRRGVVHRDIKPDNVLVSDAHALVTDFGVAKALGQSAEAGASLTTAGIAVGTPTYMAPEQAAGDTDVDHRADIYAVGVLAYELLTGQPPFAGRSVQQLLAARLTEAPTPVGTRRSDLPSGLERVVMQCLERDPNRRFQSADDLVRALTGLVTPGALPVGPGVARLRRVRLSHVVLGVVALGAVGWGLLTRLPRAVAPASSAATIAVLPFAVRGGDDIAYLGDGIVNLLSTSLDGAGDLRSVDPRALLGAVRRQGGGALDPDRAATIAATFGAGSYVLGDIVQAGERLRIDATLYNRGGPGPTRAAVTVEGDVADVFRLVDALARLLAARSNIRGGRVTRIAAVTTGSLPALKAYLEGETEFRAGRFNAAVDAFEAAVAADTAFALAYYRLSVATEWALRPDDANAAAELAVRHAARLSQHDRALLDALLAARRGDFVEAERRYRAIVALYPDDVEAWFQLGEVLFHAGRLFGRPLTDSRAPFDRVVALEPEHATALIHLVRIAAVDRDAVLGDSLADRVLRLNPSGDRVLEVEALRLDLRGEGADWDGFAAALSNAEPAVALQGIFSVYEYGTNLAAAERLLAGLTGAESPELRTAARMRLAHAQALQGRWREARETMAAPDAAHSVELLVHRAFLATLPFFPIAADTLRQLARTLTAWDATAEPPNPLPSAYFNVHDGLYPAIRIYLLGLVADRLGDSAGTRRYADELGRWRGPPRSADVARRWELGLRARVLVARGRPAEALALLEPAMRAGDYERKLFSPLFSHAAERFLIGALLAESGRPDDAREWLGSMQGFAMFDRTLEAPAAWRIGQLFERQGQPDSAAAYYARVVDLWRDADPELQPMVADARARLAALRGDR